MENTENLGTAIACLKVDQDNLHDTGKLLNDDLVHSLRIRSIALQASGSDAKIFNKIPDHTCFYEKPFLSDNTDFFLMLFLSDSESASCSKLIQHLNSCFSCFEIFTEVVRDYYQQYQLISEKA